MNVVLLEKWFLNSLNVGSNVAVKLAHKRLAEAHHFCITATLWVKVRSTLASTKRKTGQAIFEYLWAIQFPWGKFIVSLVESQQVEESA